MKKKKVKGEKTKAALKIAKIKWLVKEVPLDKILYTEGNYKIKTDLGEERLQFSLSLFGLAGTIICNSPDSKGFYKLIDGNSRVKDAREAGEKTIMVSYPKTPLSAKQYKEMAAMYDFAKAGEVDIERINKDLGTTEDFYKKWNMEVPFELLNNMGAKANIKELQYPGSTKEGKSKNGSGAAPEVNDIQMVQLFFSTKQEAEFRKLEEKLGKKFKTENNTTLTVLKAFRYIK